MKKIKQIWISLWTNTKKNSALIIAFIITYLVPVALLSEIMSFTKEVPTGTKISFMGCLAIGILLIIFYKKIKESIIRLKKGVLRGILRIIMTAILWGVVFGIILGLQYIASAMKDYWIDVAFCFAFGHVFYMIDEIKKSKTPVEEEIKEESGNE